VNRALRLARLLRILAAIIAEPGLNPLELAARAGVSDRTLRRDLAQLRELGYEVAYTSGYEVQEKLNLDGRKRAARPAEDPETELLKAVAQAMGSAGLWKPVAESTQARRPPAAKHANGAKPKPIVLLSGGHGDTDFIYATGFDVETAVYLRFDEKDDVIYTSPLEICLLYTSPSPRDLSTSRMPSSA